MVTNIVPKVAEHTTECSYHNYRRVAALARIAHELTPRQIAALISRAIAGHADVMSALEWDCVDVDDLRALLAGRVASQALDPFQWTVQWVGIEPRLFIVAPSMDCGLAFVEAQRLDPYRTHVYTDPVECRRDVATNDALGCVTEVVILGGAP